MLKKSIMLVVLLVLVGNVFGQVITLDSLRKQDANGVPLLLGQTVTVQGTVTTQGELGVPLVYLQSPTAVLLVMMQYLVQELYEAIVYRLPV